MSWSRRRNPWPAVSGCAESKMMLKIYTLIWLGPNCMTTSSKRKDVWSMYLNQSTAVPRRLKITFFVYLQLCFSWNGDVVVVGTVVYKLDTCLHREVWLYSIKLRQVRMVWKYNAALRNTCLERGEITSEMISITWGSMSNAGAWYFWGNASTCIFVSCDDSFCHGHVSKLTFPVLTWYATYKYIYPKENVVFMHISFLFLRPRCTHQTCPKKAVERKKHTFARNLMNISFRCPKAVAFNKPTKKNSEKHMLSRKLPSAFFLLIDGSIWFLYSRFLHVRATKF